MKLDKNSISSKLYRWFYCTDELPVSLCPYFWSLVIACIFSLPIMVISLPTVMMTFEDEEKLTFMKRIAFGVLMWFLITVLFCLFMSVTLFFTTYESRGLVTIASAGIVFWIVIITLILIFAFGKLKDHISYKNRIKKQRDEYGRIIIPEKKPSIVIEFVKAKYNRYCPKIEWVDSDKN